MTTEARQCMQRQFRHGRLATRLLVPPVAPALSSSLEQMGTELYTHQAEAVSRVRAGQDSRSHVYSQREDALL